MAKAIARDNKALASGDRAQSGSAASCECCEGEPPQDLRCCPRLGAGTPLVVTINAARINYSRYQADQPNGGGTRTFQAATGNIEWEPQSTIASIGFPPACSVSGGILTDHPDSPIPDTVPGSPLSWLATIGAAASYTSTPTGIQWVVNNAIFTIDDDNPSSIDQVRLRIGPNTVTTPDGAPDYDITPSVSFGTINSTGAFVGWSLGDPYDYGFDNVAHNVTIEEEPCFTRITIRQTGNLHIGFNNAPGTSSGGTFVSWVYDITIEAMNYVHNSDEETSPDCCSGGFEPCDDIDATALRYTGHVVYQGTHVNLNAVDLWTIPMHNVHDYEILCTDTSPPCNGTLVGGQQIFFSFEHEWDEPAASADPNCGAGSATAVIRNTLEVSGFWDISSGGVFNGYLKYQSSVLSFSNGGLGSEERSEILVEFRFEWDGVDTYALYGPGGFGSDPLLRYDWVGFATPVEPDTLSIAVTNLEGCRFQIVVAGLVSGQKTIPCPPPSTADATYGYGAAPFIDLIFSAE